MLSKRDKLITIAMTFVGIFIAATSYRQHPVSAGAWAGLVVLLLIGTAIASKAGNKTISDVIPRKHAWWVLLTSLVLFLAAFEKMVAAKTFVEAVVTNIGTVSMLMLAVSAASAAIPAPEEKAE
jgi:hypothetical protein